jgi:predicted XRE-type DNA-binding protein
MKDKDFAIIRGSGKVHRDVGDTGADIKQLKAILAAAIIKSLDASGLTVRKANAQTGIAAADFSRIRNADLRRFTVYRLMTIINRLDSRVDAKVSVRKTGRKATETRLAP